MLFFGNTVLNISINPPSVTPTAPGDGIPETVPYSTDCMLIIFNILFINFQFYITYVFF